MDTYTQLERQMVTYSELLMVPVIPKSETMVRLTTRDIANGYLKQMKAQENTLGPGIIVRRAVRAKLKRAQQRLTKTNPDLELYVAFGYRTLEFQEQRFKEQLCSVIQSDWNSDPVTLYETAHRRVAVPTVAGHPTGGAVDIYIRNRTNSQPLHFGSEMYDYSTKRCYTFSPDLTANERVNRLLLRSVLMQEGFAPFDGEWWHFSYGDREWAYYYKQPFALYTQISCQEVLEKLR